MYGKSHGTTSNRNWSFIKGSEMWGKENNEDWVWRNYLNQITFTLESYLCQNISTAPTGHIPVQTECESGRERGTVFCIKLLQ